MYISYLAILSTTNHYIERNYDHELVMAGEQLWLDGQVKNQSLNDDGCYRAIVSDDKHYEIEISTPFSKKQKTSCSCSAFKSSSVCTHIVAGLFAIRNIPEEKNKNRVPKAISKPSSLNINQMINDIHPNELKDFLKSYAKTDRRFSILFKAAFARKTDLSDNIEKYKSILDAIVKPVTSKTPKLPVSDLKYLIKVLSEFADQINDGIALSHYREGVNIFIASFSKLAYVRSRFSMSNEEINALNITYHNIISYFFASKLPTELKRELFNFLLEFMQRSYYMFDSFYHNILYHLIPKLTTSERKTVKTVLLDLLKIRPNTEHAVILAYYLKISKKYTTEATDYFSQYPLQLMEVVHLLLNDEDRSIAIEILEKTYKSRPNDRDIMNRLLYIYIQTNNQDAFKALAKKAFINSGDNKYLSLLKKELPDHTYTQVILDIESHILTQSNISKETALKFFLFEDNWAAMVLYFEKHPDLEMLQKYDAFIYLHDQDAVASLYIQILDDYFSTLHPDEILLTTEKLNNHWRQQKMQSTIQQLGDFLKGG